MWQIPIRKPDKRTPKKELKLQKIEYYSVNMYQSHFYLLCVSQKISFHSAVKMTTKLKYPAEIQNLNIKRKP